MTVCFRKNWANVEKNISTYLDAQQIVDRYVRSIKQAKLVLAYSKRPDVVRAIFARYPSIARYHLVEVDMMDVDVIQEFINAGVPSQGFFGVIAFALMKRNREIFQLFVDQGFYSTMDSTLKYRAEKVFDIKYDSFT